MKYGIILGLISIMAAFHAFRNPFFFIPLIWISISTMIVSMAYTGCLPRAFYKRKNGTILTCSKILNLPFLSYTSGTWHIYRILSRENPFDKISDSLTIGRRLLPKEISERYDCYVDLTAEFDEPKTIREKSSYICLPILDASTPKIKDFINLLKQIENKKIFIHCAQGHGRTGLVALAFIMRKGLVKDPKEGILHLQSLRPALKLNNNQINYLEKYKKVIME